MFFKRRISVSDYCRTRLDLLFSRRQDETWLSGRSSYDDRALLACSDSLFLDNMRALHVEFIGIPIAKKYPRLGLDAIVYIDRYLKERGHQALEPLIRDYNTAFGSSWSDGVQVMVQVFSDRVTGGQLSMSTTRLLYDDFCVALRSMDADFDQVRLVSD